MAHDWQTITSSQTVPFDLSVSVVPENENQYITISPDTENEEIFYYTTKTWTTWSAWVLTITWRWYSKVDDSTSVWNQKEHTINNIYKWALNHIIINDKSSLEWDNTYSWSNTFNWDVYLWKWFRVPEFDDATERDAAIPSPEDGMLCYLQDVEDYYSYKNGIWVKLYLTIALFLLSS